MCGILGVFSKDQNELNQIVVNAIKYLHRRGPDSFGVAFINPLRRNIVTQKHLNVHRSERNFLVSIDEERERQNFFSNLRSTITSVNAKMALVQTRYATSERNVKTESIEMQKKINDANSQPIQINYDYENKIYDMGVAVHNGNIPILEKKRIDELITVHSAHLGTVDSRILTELYMQKLREFKGDHRKSAEWIVTNVSGSYSFIYSDGNKLVAFKDRWSVRPLCMGKSENSIVIVSESGFLSDMGMNIEREISAGELVEMDRDGNLKCRKLNVPVFDGFCRFEPHYQMDFHSLCPGQKYSVDRCRNDTGYRVAKFYADIVMRLDVISSVPDSGNSYVRGFVQSSGKLNLAIMRKVENKRYYLNARNSQDRTQNTGGHKYSYQKRDIEGNSIGLVDDSLMRGDTFMKIFLDLVKLGAKEVHLFSMWPPNIFKCDKGNDTQTNEELIAHQLVTQGIIFEENGKYTYKSIREVNQKITEILRLKVNDVLSKTQNEDSKNNPSEKLFVHYAPNEIIEDVYRGQGCSFCVTGKDLPGWCNK